MNRILWMVAVVVATTVATPRADDSDRLLTIDHYVRVTSTVPAIAGQPAQLYVRERVLAGGALRSSSTALARRRRSPLTFRTRTTAGWHSWRGQDSMFSPWT
jgi:hypothetical protein